MPMIMTPEQQQWFQVMRSEWLRVMRPLDGYGPGDLFPSLPPIPAELLESCKLLPSRFDILRCLRKGGRVAEIGTQEGIFAESIVEVCQPDELHLFDIDFTPLHHRGSGLSGKANLHLGDSSTLLAAFDDEYFDWIYIDGDHSFEGVQNDTAIARRKVKRGGNLIFNDFTLWSPVECVDYGIPHAACELAANRGWRFVYFALHPLMYCDVALERPLDDVA
jgi:hypothetical protein